MALLLLALQCGAPAENEAERIKRLEALLRQPWLAKAAWHTDYDEARAAADESGKPIFAYFTVSYFR